MTDNPYKWYDGSAVGTGRGLAGRGGSEYDIFS